MRVASALFLVIGAAALAWMVVHLGPATMWRGLRLVGWGLAIGGALHAVGLILDSVLLRACTAHDGVAPTLGHLIRTSVSGHAINEATPLGKLGEITKFTILCEVISKHRAAAALVAQNLVMFVVNCTLIALAPPIAALAVGADGKVVLAFAACGGVFLVLGAGTLVVLARGIGGWPFSVLRRLGVGPRRIARWRKQFTRIEQHWRAAAHDRRGMVVAWLAGVLSRLCSVAESAVYFALAGGDQASAAGFLSLAGSAAIGWLAFFVPFQAGAGEGGAFAIFEAVGLSGETAVVVELARRLRRLIFIAIGVGLLAWTAARSRRPASPAD